MNRQLTAMVIILATSVNPLLVGAAGLPANFVAANRSLPPVVAQVLPVPQNPAALTQPGVIPGVSSITTSPNSLVINQNQPRTVIDWKSFNIGANSWVYFKQQKMKTNSDGSMYIDPATTRPVWEKQPDWIALNRIYDLNPSQIYGKLQADGKVYLINQNGILFGAGSQINVHSLIASTLNFKMADSTFLDPATAVNLTFKGESYQTDAQGAPVPFDPASAVSNLGTIKTDELGSVFLLAPKVENAGSISSPMGQIGLVAGTDLVLAPDTSGNSTRTALVAKVNGAPGLVVNQEAGLLEADNGLVGMYGGTVQQQGIIRSITAVKVNGQIELKASELVQTGAKSITETPPDTSAEKVHESFPYNGGTVLIGGLDSDNTALASTSVKRIDHQGLISSPSGTATLKASERAMLGAGSTIDVSGLWLDKPASDRMTSVMLGSVVLRDAQQQKSGILLGQTVTVDPLTGSTIGDISGSIASQELTTRERSVNGGAIAVSVPMGDIISSPGSTLNFSGGGVRYGSGEATTTWLVSGSKGYPISAAPAQLAYDLISSTQSFTNSKYGITKSYSGLYLGGASSVNNTISNYIEGADAGTATLSAKRVDLYGSLDGHVTRGFYQNVATELTNSLGQQITLGRAEPVAGTFTLGIKPSDDPTVSNSIVDTITVRQSVTPQVHDLPVADVPQVTEVSASILSAAGLGSLNLYANNMATFESGSRILMNPGSGLTTGARRIEYRGEISIPGGSVTLKTSDNMTPLPVDTAGKPLESLIYIAEGSSISVAGQRTNLAGGGTGLQQYLPAAHINGGSVTIADDTDTGKGVIIRTGSSIDAEGGYLVDTKGKVTGGNAGMLALQGDAIIIDGDLHGASLPGKNGGTLVLHAGNVAVVQSAQQPLAATFDASSPLPPDRVGRVVASADAIAASGFSTVDLFGRSSVNVDPGVTLATSNVKLLLPVSGGVAGGGAGQPRNTVAPLELTTSADYQGVSSLTLAGGVTFAGSSTVATGNLQGIDGMASQFSSVSVGNNTTLRSGPGGQINLLTKGQFDLNKLTYAVKPDSNVKFTDHGTIALSGKLDAPGGKITVLGGGDVTMNAGAEISAAGYVRNITAATGGGTVTPMAAGDVKMIARNGALTLPDTARIDVSGSSPVATQVVTDTGKLVSVTQGSEPGSVSLTYGGALSLAGSITGKTTVAEGRGSAFSLTSLNETIPLTVDSPYLTGLADNGFDAVTLGSKKAILFPTSLNLILGRSLSLDAPEIIGSGAYQVSIQAPWVRLANSTQRLANGGITGTTRLSISGDWVDVTGQIALSGFSSTTFDLKRDVRLYDRFYATPSDGRTNVWLGSLSTGGDLTLKADRIYPGMQTQAGNIDPVYNPGGDLNFIPSAFTLTSEGKITTLPSDVRSDQAIYSAGGSLTLNAKGGIEHRGTLAAPLGTINLNTDPVYGSSSRVYLAEGSRLTTAGSALVPYGFVDTDQNLNVIDKSNSAVAGVVVTAAPGKSVTIGGNEIVVREGATIDITGGGSVYSYKFQSGIEGSFNPLTVKGRFVILPDSPITAPGDAVYLNSGNGVAAGAYSILPEQYAFLPGALVITDLGVLGASGVTSLTKEGYPVVSGFAGAAGTSLGAPQLHTYSVRSALDVRKEGNFSLNRVVVAGEAGTVTIKGTTTILNGTIFAQALSGSAGGMVALSGGNIVVAAAAAPLPATFAFDTPFDGDLKDLKGTLYLASGALAGKGFREIDLGVIDTANPASSTATVTLKQGSALSAPIVSLAAVNGVTLENGVAIAAIDPKGGGTASVLTKGTLTIQSNAQIHASDRINLDAASLDAPGTTPLLVDHGVLGITGDHLNLASDAYLTAHPGVPAATPGIYLTETFWSSVNGFGSLELKSRNDLTFLGDVALAMKKDANQNDIPLSLTLDAARIGVQNPGNQGVNVSVTKLSLVNSGSASTLVAPDSSGAAGRLNLTAVDATIGLNAVDVSGPPKDRKGDLIFNGFGKVNLAVTNDLALAGVGRVMTGGADLSLTAARVATTYFSDATTPYRAAGFTVDAGTTGTVTLSRSAGTAGSSATPGGSLQINARNIEQTGTVQATAGQVSYTAQGTINLTSGAEILARGFEYPAGRDGVKPTDPGGKVLLVAKSGTVNVDQGARIDVSAVGAGDAGSINLSAPVGGVTLKGELLGTATGGKGGSLTLQTTDLSGFADGFSTLNSTVLAHGGFTEAINIRTRTASSLTVATGDTVKARSVVLAVDGGDLNIKGTIDASGATGGRVELYAGANLTVSGALDAHATGAGASGGDIILGAGGFDGSGNPTGRLKIAGGSINVSGAGAGYGGTVTLRAPRSATAMNADLNGSIVGAGQVIAEAFKSYNQTSVTATTITTLKNDTQSFMNGAVAETQRLGSGLHLTGGSASSVHLQPGIELRSSGDLTVTAPWDLTSWRYAGETGSLTLRAAGNLTLKSISDAPTPATTLVAATAQPSWNYTFVAGSDLAAANPVVTRIVSHPDREGVFTTGVNETVYTESGNVRFASGGDTIISAGKSPGYMLDASTFMRYSLATYRGAIEGQVGGSLSFQGATGVQAALQSATGSIALDIGGDLNLLAGIGNGAIRTTGEYNPASTSSTKAKEFWNFAGGGDIAVTLGGSVKGSLDKNAWDMVTQRRTAAVTDYFWSPAYTTGSGQYATAGLATMGGGNLTLKSGGDISGQVGVFGSGNLMVISGGDLNGRFLSGLGSGTLHSASSVGNSNGTVLEALQSSRVDLVAQGDVKIATIANPSVAGDKALAYQAWNLRYGADTAVGLTSMTGDIHLTGQADPGIYSSMTAWSTRLLPPTLVMTAARDITIENSFYLAPSATGTLTMSAGRDLDGSTFAQTGNGPVPFKGSIVMGDGDPALVYGVQSRTSYPNANQFSTQTHASALVALRSAATARITAGRDIKNVQIALARSAGITAGRDISNLLYSGQNNRTDDVTSIKAGRDISFSSAGGQLDTLEAGFQLGGPGSLTVQAGNTIDLGSSKGVQTFGNFYNLGFGAKGSDVTIVAGLGDDINQVLGAMKDSGSFTALTPDQDPAAVSQEQRLFDTLRGYGQKASDLSASGDTAGAKAQIETARTKLIKPLFSTAGEATGIINMTSSQISTNSGADAINIIAGGVINVGKSTLILDKTKATSQQQSTGIYTANGGPINMLSVGNMNVNESRVMTFRGGDITMWSDQGGINAGRGSRTAINAQPPKLVRSNPNDPNSPLVVQFTPPAVGSGIAAKWYNKGLAPETPMMGNIYPFAPSGYIDAGEAGISGNKIAYYAPTVLNAGNFTAASGPAPSTSGPGVSLGSLSGTGSMSQATKSMEQSTTMATAGDQGASLKKKLMDDLVASWLDVKIISFDTPEQTEPQDGPLEKKRR